MKRLLVLMLVATAALLFASTASADGWFKHKDSCSYKTGSGFPNPAWTGPYSSQANCEAAPPGPNDVWTITLTATPNPVALNGDFTFSGVLALNYGSTGADDQTVTITPYTDSSCSTQADDSYNVFTTTTQSDGSYSDGPITANFDTAGDYFYQATSDDAKSGCLDLMVGVNHPLIVTPPPPPPSSVFLCYSASQTNPGVWLASQAASLMAQGYWSPYAVAGNVTGGTNVGKYHLVCNLAAGQAAGQQFAGDDGYVAGTDLFNALTGAPGWYPVVP